MRLQRLNLARYGKFTDHVIDFGERIAGAPDLHLVYGPNEAGKSTAFAAFLDLLFGIETRSRYDFLHPYSAMRIEACLELQSGTHELVRVKKPQNSLLDANDRPVGDGVIAAELGGLDRDSYRMRFSLDDDTLEAGGETILASKGDLGQLLFSASAGLADVSRTLIALKDEADSFYKFRARSGELAALKAELAALKEERGRADLLAGEYAQLAADRDRAEALYADGMAERGRTEARMGAVTRQLNAWPRLAALRQIRERLAPLADLPPPPAGWLEALPKLEAEAVELRTRAEALEEDVAQLAADLDAIAVDKAALNQAGRADELAEGRARHRAGAQELPERRLELRQADMTVAGLLARLDRAGETEPRRLLLSASQVGRLRALIEARSGLDVAVDAARREQQDARLRLEEARARLKAAGGNGATRGRQAQLAALAAAAAKLRGSDHGARRRVAEQDLVAQSAALGELQAKLAPWAGDPARLADLAVPSAQDIERWKSGLAEAERQAALRQAELERFEAEQRRAQAERDALGQLTGLVGDKEAAELRAARERAWAKHRRLLEDASAEAFEAALRRDDVATMTRLTREKEAAALHELARKLAVLEVELDRARQLRDAASASRHGLQEEIAALFEALGLPRATSLAQLEAWLARRERAIEAHALLAKAERALAEAASAETAARKELAAALLAIGEAPGDAASAETLLAAAQAALDRESELKALRAQIEDCERDLKRRERALSKAEADEARWREAWGVACAGCWLSEPGGPPEVAELREILAALAELGPVLEGRAALAARIEAIEAEQAGFAAEVEALAAALGLPPMPGQASELARIICDRAQEARAAAAARARKAEELAAARHRQRALAEARAHHEGRAGQMRALFAVETLTDLRLKLQGCERKAELEQQAQEAERDILGALQLSSLAEAEAALDAADRASLAAELAELKAAFDHQDQRARDLFTAFSKAADRLDQVGGDDAAARIEERRRTLLLQIEEKARGYIKLKAGIAAAEHALQAYRERHRSSMLQRASEAFRTISRGAYSGLTTQLDKDSEILIAVAAGGGSKVASELSKGTRFQLYLALRLAGYYEFAESRPPVPFIADDIMETFDDFRAEEACRLFGEMARVGQVIYLTHHKHLCDIARSVCPGVRVHHLPSLMAA